MNRILRWTCPMLGLILCLLATTPAQAQVPALLQPLSAQEAGDASPKLSARLEQIRKRPTTGSITLTRINTAALQAPAMSLALGARIANFKRDSGDALGPNVTSWSGTLSDIPGQATLVVHDGNVTGSVQHDGELFRIEPLGNGLHALIKVDTSRLPPEHPPSFQEIERRAVPPASAPSPRGDAANDGPVGIDVLVAYTASASSAVSDIAATIQLAVAEANQSYVNSKINIRLNLVDTLSAGSYSESGKSYDTILSDLVGMQTVKDHRNSSGADLVAMIINQTDYCGLADAISATADTAYVVVHYDCATGYYSFAHELGHLMGARHDPDTDPTNTPFPYGHGYRYESGATKWRTVMAYNCPDNCSRLQYWSNPEVSYNGVVMGNTTVSNNARVLNERASTVAAFRARPPVSTVGSIWSYTGTSCGANGCPGWKMLDNNAATVRIVSAGSKLYQLHDTGRIWEYTGTACNGASCPGWKMLDNNPATIAIVSDGTTLYQLHNTGRIWRYTGTACNGNSCPGWTMLDNNPAALAIAADGGQLYQLHNTGRIWRFTGVACSGNSCPGWRMLDNNPATVSIAAGAGKLYQLHDTGKVWRHTGVACSGNSCPGWTMLDNNPATVAIVAGNQLYQLHNTGRVWRHTGVACSGNSCPGWTMLDNNPATIALYAGSGSLYQLHNTGRAWQSTGAACSGNSCPGWTLLDNNPATGRLSTAQGQLFQLHTSRKPMARTRTCYDCR